MIVQAELWLVVNVHTAVLDIHCLNVIVAFHTLGIAHQSANVLLFAPQVTKCQLVGVDGKVRESCFL